MDILDILKKNKEYNKEHPNEYPKRPEYFIKHFRVLGKHNNRVKLFKRSIEIRKFFYDTAGIANQNTYIGFLNDKLSTFANENIIWVDGKYFKDIIELVNSEFVQIDREKLFHTTDELKLDADEIGRIISEYMISTNISLALRNRIKQLITDFYYGNNLEFYIIMNPRENLKYTSDNKIIIPDKDVIYSSLDVEEINMTLDDNIHELKNRLNN